MVSQRNPLKMHNMQLSHLRIGQITQISVLHARLLIVFIPLLTNPKQTNLNTVYLSICCFIASRIVIATHNSNISYRRFS